MNHQLSQPLASFNNDRMAAFSAFRAPNASQSPTQMTILTQNHISTTGQAAPALPTSNPPKPAQLSEEQAHDALEQVQHNVEGVLNAHNGIDPERVARLLSLLD